MSEDDGLVECDTVLPDSYVPQFRANLCIDFRGRKGITPKCRLPSASFYSVLFHKTAMFPSIFVRILHRAVYCLFYTFRLSRRISRRCLGKKCHYLVLWKIALVCLYSRFCFFFPPIDMLSCLRYYCN